MSPDASHQALRRNHPAGNYQQGHKKRGTGHRERERETCSKHKIIQNDAKSFISVVDVAPVNDQVMEKQRQQELRVDTGFVSSQILFK